MTSTSDAASPAGGPGPADGAAMEELEDVEDAYLEGDRGFTPGSARAAFAHPTFRTVYLGAFASNIGTWMQNVVLGALAYNLTHSGVFVGAMIAAQLGPLLLFSVVGGMIADAFDRKRALLLLSFQQAAFSLILAAVTIPDRPSKVAMLGVVACIGIGNALYAPIFSAVVPVLVPRRDLAGAISLNSVQMNASRVIGPVIGSTIYAHTGPSWVFVLNAASFGFVIASLLRVTLPPPPDSGGQGLHRLVDGFRVAQRYRVIGQCLAVIFTFSFFCLPFITQLPKIASDNLAINPKSSAYGWLYTSFGAGAVIGALSIGTVFVASSKARLTRTGLLGFAAMLTTFGLMRSALPAYVAILVLGAVYFAVITSLSTVLQEEVDDADRGKVMALWIMGFGGTVPFGGLLGGVVAERFGLTAMVLAGTAVAVALAWWADLQPVRPGNPLGLVGRARPAPAAAVSGAGDAPRAAAPPPAPGRPSGSP